MRGFFRSTLFKVICVIVIVLLVLGIVVTAAGMDGSPLKTAFNAVVVPVQNAVTSVGEWMSGVFGVWGENSDLREENQALREENQKLTEKLVDYEKMKQENDLYKDYLRIRDENEDFEFVPAVVISRDPSNRFGSFTINKGAINGVALQDPVITADGVVGYISEVGATYATVRTVLDPEIGIGAIDSRTRSDTGVVNGDIRYSADGLTTLNYLARNCSVASGDIIITTGIGGVFPSDLVVGTVTQVELSGDKTYSYAVIEPAADILNLSDVFVITDFEGQGNVLSEESAQATTEAK